MEATEAIDLLRESTRKIASGQPHVSVAYSGGLDSSVIAAIAREFATVHCYACAVEGSFDAGNAASRAESESLDFTLIPLNTGQMPSIVREAVELLQTLNPLQLAYTIPILTVLKESTENLVLAGNGADELFGGYAKYASAKDPSKLMADDIDKMLQEGERLKAAAIHFKKHIGFPFASEKLMAFSRSLPLDRKITPFTRKVILREVARNLGLPSHNLPKKAAQYSSGTLKEMEKLARAEGISLSEWTRRIAGATGRSP